MKPTKKIIQSLKIEDLDSLRNKLIEIKIIKNKNSPIPEEWTKIFVKTVFGWKSKNSNPQF